MTSSSYLSAVRQVEDESAVGPGFRLDAARTVEDDRPGDRIQPGAHHLAPDLRGPGSRGEKQENKGAASEGL